MVPLISKAAWTPKISVVGLGGGGGNAINNMIARHLCGVEFIAANTDAQALSASKADYVVQLGLQATGGLGAGSLPEIGRIAAEESIEALMTHLSGTQMCFLTAGMGGGTGTGAAPVVAAAARAAGMLTIAVVTEPFRFEGNHRARQARIGIDQLIEVADTVIVVPNQELLQISNAQTPLKQAFSLADNVLHSGISAIVDLIGNDGLINLDFADVRSVTRNMGRGVMATGEAAGPARAATAARAAVHNPLFGNASLYGAGGVLVSLAAGRDLTLFEVDEAASVIRDEVDAGAEIVLGATFDEGLGPNLRVSIIATGLRPPAEIIHLADRVHGTMIPHAQDLAAERHLNPGNEG